jgi:hypothetical protein
MDAVPDRAGQEERGVSSQNKCGACGRGTATHAEGCSRLECPNRKPQVWGGPEGAQGFPGLLAEERIARRMREKDRCIEVQLEEL